MLQASAHVVCVYLTCMRDRELQAFGLAPLHALAWAIRLRVRDSVMPAAVRSHGRGTTACGLSC